MGLLEAKCAICSRFCSSRFGRCARTGSYRKISGGAEILILNPTSSQPAASMVKCYAQTICLKNDPRGIEEYKRHHADCWPEVLGALKSVGVLRMKKKQLETRKFM